MTSTPTASPGEESSNDGRSLDCCCCCCSNLNRTNTARQFFEIPVATQFAQLGSSKQINEPPAINGFDTVDHLLSVLKYMLPGVFCASYFGEKMPHDASIQRTRGHSPGRKTYHTPQEQRKHTSAHTCLASGLAHSGSTRGKHTHTCTLLVPPTSAVPMRWPETLRTSSTRPVIQ